MCGARARVSNVLFVSVHNILLHFCSRILPLLSPTLLLLLAFLAFLPLARVRVFFLFLFLFLLSPLPPPLPPLGGARV